MEKLVSIIIPVFNSERYLHDLLDSVISQDYSNVEIICINDGSTDSSEKILCEYASNYNHIKVTSIQNKGVSAARNLGISLSSGNYIYFCDSDDILHKSLISVLVRNIDGAELSFVDFIKYDGVFSETEDSEKLDKKEFTKIVLEGNGYLWNKLFVASIIKENNIRFYENIRNREDLIFIFEYLKFVKTVGKNSSKLYFYRLNENGAANIDKFTESKITSCIAQGKLIDIVEKDNSYDDYIKQFVVEESITLYSYYLKDLLLKTLDFRLKKKWIPFILNEYNCIQRNKKVKMSKIWNIKTKIYYINLRIMASIFRFFPL